MAMQRFIQALMPLAVCSAPWHAVDIQQVSCPGGNGSAELVMQLPNASNSPYIFTIFRTSKQAVEIDFTATDANGKLVTQQKVKLDKLSGHGRRLEGVVEGSPPRQLSARRRGGGGSRGGFSGGGGGGGGGVRGFTARRRTSSPSFSSPRRRVVRQPPRYASQRRRTVTSPSGSYNPRTGTNSFSNPSYPGGGAYGYGSQGQLYNNYGGRPPMQTGYGYSGANAITAGGSSSIPLALGGGLLTGAVGGMLLGNLMHGMTRHKHNMESLSMLNCTSGTWRGLCSECIKRFAAKACSVDLSPDVNISRDDLMGTGFFPREFSGPITVKVTRLSGQDFGSSAICPPTGWNSTASNDSNATDTNSTTWTLPSSSGLFFTLTQLDEVQDAGTAQMSGSRRWAPMLTPATAAIATALSVCISL